MFTFAVTAFEEMSLRRGRGLYLRRCLSAAISHLMIDEIIVSNDSPADAEELEELLTGMPKVRLVHQRENVGAFCNKFDAIAAASNNWVIFCDSDNQMGRDCLDSVTFAVGDPRRLYCPSYARPTFDYRDFLKHPAVLTRYDIHQLSLHPMFQALLNTGNWTVHRDLFVSTFEAARHSSPSKRVRVPNLPLHLTGDTLATRLIWDANEAATYNYGWLSAGFMMNMVAGMEYYHQSGGGGDGLFAVVNASDSRTMTVFEVLRDAICRLHFKDHSITDPEML